MCIIKPVKICRERIAAVYLFYQVRDKRLVREASGLKGKLRKRSTGRTPLDKAAHRSVGRPWTCSPRARDAGEKPARVDSRKTGPRKTGQR